METTTYNHHHVDTIHELGWNKTEIIVLIDLKTKSLDGVGPVALVPIDRMDIDRFIC